MRGTRLQQRGVRDSDVTPLLTAQHCNCDTPVPPPLPPAPAPLRQLRALAVLVATLTITTHAATAAAQDTPDDASPSADGNAGIPEVLLIFVFLGGGIALAALCACLARLAKTKSLDDLTTPVRSSRKTHVRSVLQEGNARIKQEAVLRFCELHPTAAAPPAWDSLPRTLQLGRLEYSDVVPAGAVVLDDDGEVEFHEVAPDGYEVEDTEATQGSLESTHVSLQTNRPLSDGPLAMGEWMYYECRITSLPRGPMHSAVQHSLAIGWATAPYVPFLLPGEYFYSIALCSDGEVRTDADHSAGGYPLCGPLSPGDVVGCGAERVPLSHPEVAGTARLVNLQAVREGDKPDMVPTSAVLFFFTLNGERLEPDVPHDWATILLPDRPEFKPMTTVPGTMFIDHGKHKLKDGSLRPKRVNPIERRLLATGCARPTVGAVGDAVLRFRFQGPFRWKRTEDVSAEDLAFAGMKGRHSTPVNVAGPPKRRRSGAGGVGAGGGRSHTDRHGHASGHGVDGGSRRRGSRAGVASSGSGGVDAGPGEGSAERLRAHGSRRSNTQAGHASAAAGGAVAGSASGSRKRSLTTLEPSASSGLIPQIDLPGSVGLGSARGHGDVLQSGGSSKAHRHIGGSPASGDVSGDPHATHGSRGSSGGGGSGSAEQRRSASRRRSGAGSGPSGGLAQAQRGSRRSGTDAAAAARAGATTGTSSGGRGRHFAKHAHHGGGRGGGRTDAPGGAYVVEVGR